MKLYNKSPAAYRLLRETNILALPSRQTLDKEKHKDTPCVGFQHHAMDQLRVIIDGVDCTHKKMALLVIDEMKIRGTHNVLYVNLASFWFDDLSDADYCYGAFSTTNFCFFQLEKTHSTDSSEQFIFLQFFLFCRVFSLSKKHWRFSWIRGLWQRFSDWFE